MATLESPPSRYRIVEKAGRLIVTDTVTGQRNASADLPTMSDMGRGSATSVAPAAAQNQDGGQPVRMLEPSTPRTKQRPAVLPPTGPNQAKLIGLVVLGLAAAAVLLFSGLWIAVVIALLIPQVRTALLEAARTAFKRWFAA